MLISCITCIKTINHQIECNIIILFHAALFDLTWLFSFASPFPFPSFHFCLWWFWFRNSTRIYQDWFFYVFCFRVIFWFLSFLDTSLTSDIDSYFPEFIEFFDVVRHRKSFLSQCFPVSGEKDKTIKKIIRIFGCFEKNYTHKTRGCVIIHVLKISKVAVNERQ